MLVFTRLSDITMEPPRRKLLRFHKCETEERSFKGLSRVENSLIWCLVLCSNLNLLPNPLPFLRPLYQTLRLMGWFIDIFDSFIHLYYDTFLHTPLCLPNSLPSGSPAGAILLSKSSSYVPVFFLCVAQFSCNGDSIWYKQAKSLFELSVLGHRAYFCCDWGIWCWSVSKLFTPGSKRQEPAEEGSEIR